jgi:hypothetical protein
MPVQILSQEFSSDHPWLPGWQNYFENIHSVDDWRTVQPDQLVIAGSDVRSWYVRHWLNRGQPALYIGRGYVGNHTSKHRWLWRVSVNGWANTRLMPVPHSRWSIMNLPRHPWKVQQVKNVLIAPSKLTSLSWCHQSSEQWSEHMATQFPGANVRIRYKARKPWQRWETLWSDLDWADVVVAQSSAITCEAFWYGKKVISTEPCPTWACGNQRIEDWQDSGEPELRDAWHEHLAWSQYTVEEWTSGEALRLIEQYTGSALTYDPGHRYNFTAIEQ